MILMFLISSIKFVFKYLLIKNFIASEALLVSSVFPLSVIEFPLKWILVFVSFLRPRGCWVGAGRGAGLRRCASRSAA